MGDKLSFKYFVDISELVEKGLTASDVKVTCGYSQGAVVSQLKPWNAEKNIYYVDVDFSGIKIYPGGQSACRSEVQFRMAAPTESKVWDPSNDYSYEGISDTPSEPVVTEKIALYDDGKLVWGSTPDGEGPNVEGPNGGGSEEVVLGDTNGDGKIDLVDYVVLQSYLANSSTKIKEKNADLNQDGEITIADLTALRDILLD